VYALLKRHLRVETPLLERGPLDLFDEHVFGSVMTFFLMGALLCGTSWAWQSYEQGPPSETA
jgi:hypothetical protein